jgi:hypothetical protein
MLSRPFSHGYKGGFFPETPIFQGVLALFTYEQALL